MFNFEDLGNIVEVLSNLKESLYMASDMGLIIHYNDYLELYKQLKKDKSISKDELVEYTNLNMVFTGEPHQNCGYPIIAEFEDDLVTVKHYWSDFMPPYIEPRLIFTTDDDDECVAVLVVYEKDEEGNIIEDNYFILDTVWLADDEDSKDEEEEDE